MKDSLDGCRLYANEHGIEVVCLHLTALKLVDTGSSDSCMLVGRTIVIARPSLARWPAGERPEKLGRLPLCPLW